MTRDIWRDICKRTNAKRGRFIHISTATGQDKNGDIRRVGFTYRLSPVERAIKDLPRRGKYRRDARKVVLG